MLLSRPTIMLDVCSERGGLVAYLLGRDIVVNRPLKSLADALGSDSVEIARCQNRVNDDYIRCLNLSRY